MRNIFDQYKEPENRLSHALAVCLDKDRILLRDFLKYLRVTPPVRPPKLSIVEQSLPLDPPTLTTTAAEEEAERNGLPDIVIHDNEAWCLLIESKVKARLTHDQLARHARTLRRRGFTQIQSVALTKSGVSVSGGVAPLLWSQLYQWLGRAGGAREWPEQLRSYLRDAEVRLTNEQPPYLTEGTLTMFDGFWFSDNNPYTYLEGKRLLKLAMEELRKVRSLRALDVDLTTRGRGAITGRHGDLVWDFLALRHPRNGGGFTSYPHLTLAVHDDHLEVAVTIPNGVPNPIRLRFLDLGTDGLVDLHAAIVHRARPLIRRGGSVHAYAVQRHYPNQRSSPIIDARIDFNVQVSQPTSSGGVRRQPEWAQFLAELLRRKRSNIQFGYMVKLPWSAKGINTAESLRLITDGWMALKPVLDTVRGRSPARARRGG